MFRQFKIMIFFNCLLGLLYVVSNYVLWNIITGASWTYYGAVATWSPLYVTPTYYPPIPQRQYWVGFSMPAPLLNTPFILFWVMFAMNLFFIIKLGRNKETKSSLKNNFERTGKLQSNDSRFLVTCHRRGKA